MLRKEVKHIVQNIYVYIEKKSKKKKRFACKWTCTVLAYVIKRLAVLLN